MKSTAENGGSFLAFNNLFGEEPVELDEIDLRAVEGKVEVKVLLKEIGQNSDEWKVKNINIFPSAKMYQEKRWIPCSSSTL
jgi:hypothetical protein